MVTCKRSIVKEPAALYLALTCSKHTVVWAAGCRAFFKRRHQQHLLCLLPLGKCQGQSCYDCTVATCLRPFVEAGSKSASCVSCPWTNANICFTLNIGMLLPVHGLLQLLAAVAPVVLIVPGQMRRSVMLMMLHCYCQCIAPCQREIVPHTCCVGYELAQGHLGNVCPCPDALAS